MPELPEFTFELSQVQCEVDLGGWAPHPQESSQHALREPRIARALRRGQHEVACLAHVMRQPRPLPPLVRGPPAAQHAAPGAALCTLQFVGSVSGHVCC